MADKDVVKVAEGGQLMFWCLGCLNLHAIPTVDIPGSPAWKWDGQMVYPTVSPSILIYPYPNHQPRCHLFIMEGKLDYLDDCEHPYVGQKVDMLPVEKWPL